MLFDHAFDMMERLVDVPEVVMDDGIGEVDHGWGPGRRQMHELEPLQPVAAGAAFAERFRERQPVE